MPSYTPSYNFYLPTVGADLNLWGGYLNDNWATIDDLLDGTTPVDGIDIDGGTLDGVVVGGDSPAAGSFTTLGATGLITGAANLSLVSATPQVRLEDTGNAGHTLLRVNGGVTSIEVDPGAAQANSELQVLIDNSAKFRLNGTGLRVGDGTAATVSFEIAGSDAILLPSGNTSARPTGVNGYIRYNSETSRIEGYVAGAWKPLDPPVVGTDVGQVPQFEDDGSGNPRYPAADGSQLTNLPIPAAGAPAWANYDQTTPAVTSSSNVSSITDVGVGTVTVNLTNNMADGDYAITYAADIYPATDYTEVIPNILASVNALVVSNPTTSAYSYSTRGFSIGFTDNARSYSVLEGDLA